MVQFRLRKRFALTRTLVIDGKQVRVRASARTPFEYREYFFADLVDDMQRVCSGAAGADTMEIVERYLWLTAKNAGEEVHADLPIDEAIPAWLDEFENMYSVYRVVPEVVDMWQQEIATTSEAKKKEDEP